MHIYRFWHKIINQRHADQNIGQWLVKQGKHSRQAITTNADKTPAPAEGFHAVAMHRDDKQKINKTGDKHVKTIKANGKPAVQIFAEQTGRKRNNGNKKQGQCIEPQDFIIYRLNADA